MFHSRALALFAALSAQCAAGRLGATRWADLPPGQDDIVPTEAGAVRGVRATQSNLRYWLAVPFAETTGGDNQWRPPQQRVPWNGNFDATNWGAGCTQPHHGPDAPKNQSQDCLNVNIFAPILPAGTTTNVMVFLYGGAFLEGSNQGPFDIYSGQYVAANQSTVVATCAYRLGVFGWLATGNDGINGNFGLMDQAACLAWVQRNIAAFGGDPARVTVFGESAGAMSIGLLLTNDIGKGLFSRAIMESNVASYNYKNLSEASVYGQTFCGLLNCSTGATCNSTCIRSKPANTVMDAWGTATDNVLDFLFTDLNHILDGLLGTGPTIDGTYIKVEPESALESGNYWAAQAKVPIMLGTNTNEGETFVYDGVDFALPGFIIPIAYLGIFGFNETAAQLIDSQPRYNSSAYPDGRTPLSHVLTDYWFRCGSGKFLAGAYKAGANAWAYRYDHVYSNSSIFVTFGLPQICATSVCHASELPFVFNQVPSFTSFTPAEQVLASRMAAYWASFARSGDPNYAGRAYTFPAWEPTMRNNIIFNLNMTTESSAAMCTFWDKLDYFF